MPTFAQSRVPGAPLPARHLEGSPETSAKDRDKCVGSGVHGQVSSRYSTKCERERGGPFAGNSDQCMHEDLTENGGGYALVTQRGLLESRPLGLPTIAGLTCLPYTLEPPMAMSLGFPHMCDSP